MLKQLSLSSLICLLMLGFVISSCSDDDPTDQVSSTVHTIALGDDAQDKAQEAMISMEDGDVIEFEEGTYNFTSTLSIEGKKDIAIRGAGQDKTILSFAGQTAGAQGILGSNLENFMMSDLTVQDSGSDAIKIKDSKGISFMDMATVWLGEVTEDNGAYGLYPVTSEHVLIDNCYVRGASDAGIYVGQSKHVIVRNSEVEENVAGIEIENCENSDVYNNIMRNNTGGMLIFDLPGLPVIKNVRTCRFFNNTVTNNNHPNFAAAGNMVASVPPGTGVMILSAAEVEIFDNELRENNVMSIGIVGYNTLTALDNSLSYSDEGYDPYVYNVHIHDNVIEKSDNYAEDLNFFAEVLVDLEYLFPNEDLSEIMYDGTMNPDVPAEDQLICVHDNGNAKLVNLHAPLFGTLEVQPTGFDCALDPLPEAKVEAPGI